MTTTPSPVDAIGVALQVAAAIEATGGAYFVGGSLASSLTGDSARALVAERLPQQIRPPPEIPLEQG